MSLHSANATVALIVRALVTLALLVFAFLGTDDPSLAPLIVGAVVGYWLREGEGIALGHRRLTRSRAPHEPGAAGADHPPNHDYIGPSQ